ncbi:glycerate kinase [Anopheles aquasalis]|uniref:glycerate kinase n=1 Tax=Anopheles aquasalis TaxID=42839 RepID=UPI00215B1B0C|nr:glycerate kinase [Anopheles aquasalis]
MFGALQNVIVRRMSSDRVAIEKLRDLFACGVESVKPKSLFQHCAAREDIHRSLTHDDKRYHVVGFGKAVLSMAVQIEKLLGPRLVSGCISIPIGTSERFGAGDPDFHLSPNSVLEVIECARNNLPDEGAVLAATKIRSIAQAMTENDVLCVLISGGGSALLCLPRPPITLAEKLHIIRTLASEGATITKLNCVRIILSDVKGGQLARAASGAFRLYSYIISDIVGDPIALIASGPTITTSGECESNPRWNAREVLMKYNLWNRLPASVVGVFNEPGVTDRGTARPGPDGHPFLLGSNTVAIDCIEKRATAQGLRCVVLSKMIEGNVELVSGMYVALTEHISHLKTALISEQEFKGRVYALLQGLAYPDLQPEEFVAAVIRSKREPLLIVGAGEPTVQVKGSGKGGRNQELALRFSYGVRALSSGVPERVYFLSAGTDGIDGPTDAAGAIGGACVVRERELLQQKGVIDGMQYVERNDSYRFYESLADGKYFVKTGHTGTNVMDVHLLLFESNHTK